MPSLEQMRQNHVENGHHEQAEAIAADLRRRFPALEITGPEDVESGRYIGVYVTLVPGTLRLLIQLKDNEKNHHAYLLWSTSPATTDCDRFKEFMDREHGGIEIKNEGSERPYVRVPAWEQVKGAQNLLVKNNNFDEIARNILVGLAFIAKLPTPQWNA